MANLGDLRRIVYKTIEDTATLNSNKQAKIAEFASGGFGLEAYVQVGNDSFVIEINNAGKYLIKNINITSGNTYKFHNTTTAVHIDSSANLGAVIVRKEIKYGVLTDTIITSSSLTSDAWKIIDSTKSTQLESLNVDGSVDLDGNVNIDGTFSVDGNADFDDVVISNTLAVDGDLRIGASAADKFTVAASSGNTLVAGTLKVSGITSITNDTQSNTTSSGALVVAGGVGVAGDIYAGGEIYENGSRVITEVAGIASSDTPSIETQAVITISTEDGSIITTSDEFLHIGSATENDSVAQTVYGDKT